MIFFLHCAQCTVALPHMNVEYLSHSRWHLVRRFYLDWRIGLIFHDLDLLQNIQLCSIDE